MSKTALTKKEALKKSLEMWEYLAQDIDDNKGEANPKEKYFEHLGINEDETPENNCYLCEYCLDKNGEINCYQCPINWAGEIKTPNKGYYCERYTTSPFYQWVNAYTNTPEEMPKYAQKVVDKIKQAMGED